MTCRLLLALEGQLFIPPHLPCVTLTVAVTHIAVVSTSNCLTFCTLNDFIAIEQPDQNAKITSYLEF